MCRTIIRIQIACLLWASVSVWALDTTATTIDAILASVNGMPITLSDLKSRLKTGTSVSLKEVSTNSELRAVLDSLILENLIQAEAEQRKLRVADEEIDAYVNEVASRNGLTFEGFQKALKDEGTNLADYKTQIKIDILRTKLASSMFQGKLGVSKKEIRKYIEATQGSSPSLGPKVVLKQIYVSTSDKTEENAREIIASAQKSLLDGDDFEEVAERLSESSEGKDGGTLGSFAESDLQPEIRTATSKLDPGDFSDIVRSATGFHIFLLQSRDESPQETKKAEIDPDTEQQVRKMLEREKMQVKMQEYFTTEIFKKHSVDRKV